jgi:serine-threonine kinase receptor-associated protein
LATGGKEGLLRIFDLTQCLAQKKGNAKTALELRQEISINKIVWVSDTLILCAGGNGKIYLWDTSTPDTALHTFDTQQGDEIRDLEVQTLSTNGKKIITAAAGTKVYFYDVESKTLLKEYKMPIHFRDEGGATLHPSGDKFVSGGSDLWVRVFDYETGEELECHKGHHGPIRCVRYAPDGRIYATGSEDGTIRLWKTDPENSQ